MTIYERPDFERMVWSAVKKNNYAGLIQRCGLSSQDFLHEVKTHCWLYPTNQDYSPTTIVFQQVRWTLGKIMQSNRQKESIPLNYDAGKEDVGNDDRYDAKQIVNRLMRCGELTEREREYLESYILYDDSSLIIKKMGITRQRLEQLKRTSFNKIRIYSEKILD